MSGPSPAAPRGPATGEPGTAEQRPGIRVLFVCTGNMCRSAAAERLSRMLLDELPGGRGAAVEVRSAGTRASVGSAVHPATAAAVLALGGDGTGFEARQIQRSMVTDADLVLTMTRAHRTAVLGLEPRALSRTFTLVEAAELLPLLEGTPASGPLPARLAAARRLRPGSERDDVLDPIGHPDDVHREVVTTIADCLRALVPALAADDAPAARTAGSPPASAVT